MIVISYLSTTFTNNYAILMCFSLLLDNLACLLANFTEMSRRLTCLLTRLAFLLTHFGVFRKHYA